jgi:gamma-glutamylcyclotransferase (GGCT)/AIG2-like uncharacterized protein YtfP
MNKDSLYAFYGSLRKGMDNYERYRDAMVYLYSIRLKDFKLYSRGLYPCVAKSTHENSVLVEVFRITDPQLEKEIHEMELEEGYVYEEVLINDQLVGIYVFVNIENFTEVKSGDWVTFYRENIA